MRFDAEIKKVTAKKLVSLDIEYEVVLRTSNPEILSLGAVNPESLVTVEVTVNG
jgi:hypothetical protein